MNRSISVAAVALALALAAPLGAAEWKAYGGFEPDSTYDSSDFMWFDAPAPGEKKVYFNAFQTNFEVTNPNVGAAHTQFNSVPELFWNAMLGVWTDCNGDGYVGLAETAIEEYKSEVLTLPTMQANCPDGSAHNKDGWVTELLWIGRDNWGGRNLENDSRIIPDNEAMIWGDQGRPYPVGPAAATGGSCPLAVMPKDMFHRTGAFIDYFDCHLGHNLGNRYNQVATTVGHDALPPLENPRDWDEAGHPLNVDTFGEDGTENSYFTYQDCSQPTYANTLVKPVADPYTTTVDDFWAQNVAPLNGNLGDEFFGELDYDFGPRPTKVTTNPDGNVPGTVNETSETTPFMDDCDTRNDFGHDFYTLESENQEQDLVQGKDHADLNFNFTAQTRGYTVSSEDPELEAGDKGMPVHAGVWQGVGYWGVLTGIFTDHQPNTVWRSDGGYATTPRTVRVDTSGPSVLPANATFWTFYAKVGNAGKAAGQLPSSATGTYGAQFCPAVGANSGLHNGWLCDGALWYKNSDGTPITEEFPHARPGQTYQLRDVDCFDGTLLGLPVGIETPAYGEVPCSAAPVPVYHE